jgi:hypothetical protein
MLVFPFGRVSPATFFPPILQRDRSISMIEKKPERKVHPPARGKKGAVAMNEKKLFKNFPFIAA